MTKEKKILNEIKEVQQRLNNNKKRIAEMEKKPRVITETHKKLMSNYTTKQTQLETDLLAEFQKSIEDKILLYKIIIKKNNRIIELTEDIKEIGLLKIENNSLRNEQKIIQDENEYLQDELARKQSASQKYTNEDFKQYEEIYESVFNWKQAFYKLQEITTNEHIKKTTYKSFHTAYNIRVNNYNNQTTLINR